MTTLVERRGSGFYVVSEVGDGHRSREAIVVGETEIDTETGNAIVEVGTILGKKALVGTAVASAVTGTGTGTVVPDVTAPLGPLAQAGVYRFTLTSVLANSGYFTVQAPDGSILTPLKVGTVYNTDHLKVLVSDATDFVVGDNFTITVAAAATDDQIYYPLDLAARNGTQTFAGILWGEVNTKEGEQAAVATIREAEVLGPELIYPDGATDDQKAAINSLMLAQGIIVRTYN